MNDRIWRLKQELKSIALQIKKKKSERSKENGGYVSGLRELRRVFRHKHVAYGLARGLKLEQMDSGDQLNMEWVDWTIKSMNPESKEKLYIVVNGKLSTSQQAVQGGHAVAEFLRTHPNTQWSNGHLIYLRVPARCDGNMHCHYFLRGGLNQYAEFIEPDQGNKITAYAIFGPDAEKMLKDYKLV